MCFKNCKILSLLAALGAAFVIALVVLFIAIGGERLFYTEGSTDKRGFTADTNVAMAPTEPEGSGAGAPAAAADTKPVDITPYLAKADLKLGAQLLNQCKTCHTFEKGKPAGVGPNQYGLVGRAKASSPGYTYSDALKSKGGGWDFQSLSEWLTNPKAYVPGTKMAFGGLKRPEERAAIIEYINQNFSDKPLK